MEMISDSDWRVPVEWWRRSNQTGTIRWAKILRRRTRKSIELWILWSLQRRHMFSSFFSKKQFQLKLFKWILQFQEEFQKILVIFVFEKVAELFLVFLVLSCYPPPQFLMKFPPPPPFNPIYFLFFPLRPICPSIIPRPFRALGCPAARFGRHCPGGDRAFLCYSRWASRVRNHRSSRWTTHRWEGIKEGRKGEVILLSWWRVEKESGD